MPILSRNWIQLFQLSRGESDFFSRTKIRICAKLAVHTGRREEHGGGAAALARLFHNRAKYLSDFMYREVATSNYRSAIC